MTGIPHPPIADKATWLAQRKALLTKEKALTKEYDRVNAERRRLPMVPIEKDYLFDGPQGRIAFADLFEGSRQLIIYHFMFDPEWDDGCDGCTGFVDALGDLSMLKERDTTFALISRAPLEKLEADKARHGWTVPWYSSLGSDFNYDFDVTHDAAVKPFEYNFRPGGSEGEEHGISVFFRIGENIYHTYSAYARGTENLTNSYELLDITPYGRQEDFEDSPEGWPQKPTYG